MHSLTAVFVPDHALVKDFNKVYPQVIKHDQVVMAMLDVSGYTQLTRCLMERIGAGYNAAESVGQTIKQCLDPIVDCVLNRGGDIVKYSGDSITVLWYNENEIMEAIRCCIEATVLLQNQVFKGPDGEDIKLGLHSVVHVAPIHIIYVGNETRVESVCFGTKYKKMCQSLDYASKGTILLLDVEEFTGFEHLTSSRKVEQGILLKVHLVDKIFSASFMNKSNKRLDKITLLKHNINAFVDESIIARYSNISEDSRLSEIRNVTVAFAKLTLTLEDQSMDDDAAASQFAFHLQSMFLMTINVLAYHGTIRQIAVDDKGLTIFMLFGLPPHALESSAAPAGAIISRWLSEMKVLPFRVNVGLATDRVFSGILQSRDGLRKEHALLGSAVNLAARLMMIEGTNNRIYCDATTSKGIRNILTLLVQYEPDYLRIKGYEQLVPAFPVTTSSDQTVEKLLAKSRSLLETRVGIEFHSDSDDLVWKEKVESWIYRSQSCTLFIEGQSGCGKTVTASRVITFCKKMQCIVWEVASYEIEALSPFHTLRSIGSFLTSLFGQDWNVICNALQLDIDFILQTIKDLNSVFQQNNLTGFTGTPNTKLSKENSILDDFQKIQTRIVDSLVTILNALSNTRRLIICMDDCQWQDRYSWTATNAIITQCPNILVIVISRPTREYVDPVLRQIYQSLSKLPCSIHVEVGHIKLERLQVILSQMINSNDSFRLASALHEQTSGNAFALDVLLKYLQESGKLDGGIQDPSAILPRDMTSVFVSQLDKLDPTFQKLLRTASLIGQVFDLNDLVHLCKVSILPTVGQLLDWDRFEFLIQVEDSRWRFRHCLIQYQIACLMTSGERRIWHLEIGNYFASLLQNRENLKSELLPIVHQQYKLAEYEVGIFTTACKLVGHYMNLDMPYDAERIFLQVIESTRFKGLSVLKKMKIYAHGCRALDCTNNYAAGISIFPNVLKLANLGYSKFTLLTVIRLVHQIGMLKAYWRNGKIPSIEMRDCPESEIGERLLRLWSMLDCFNNLLGRQGSFANVFYLHWLFTLINIYIVKPNADAQS